MTREQAEQMKRALTGDHEADHDVAVGACLQAADELAALTEAVLNGLSDSLVLSVVNGVEARLRAAAELAGVIELAAEAGDEATETRQ